MFQIFGIKFLPFGKIPICHQDIWGISVNENKLFGLFITQINSKSKRTFHWVLTIHVETNFFADGRWNAVAGQTEVDA